MKIHEYQAKQVLSQFGVPIPRGGVASNPYEVYEIASRLGGTVVVKAQIHAGGRGKGGGVKLASTPAEAEEIFKALDIHPVLANFVGTLYFFMGQETFRSFKTHQLKALSFTPLSYFFSIKSDWMETLQRFRKFLDQRRLAHTGKPSDEKIFLC